MCVRKCAACGDVKAVQAQCRHSKPETTLDIYYAQIVPENQRRAAEQLGRYARENIAKLPGPLLVQ